MGPVKTADEKIVELPLVVEVGFFWGLLAIIFFIRIRNLQYNTLFLDEAINAVIGEDLLAGVFDRQATTFHFGSYLYPAFSATVDRMWGVAGLRMASAVSNTVTAVFIYLSSRSLFENRTALLALIWFGFTGATINLGQLAVYDSFSILFLSAAFFTIILAAQVPDREVVYLLMAAIFAALMALSKYIGLIYIPALIVTAFILFMSQGRPLLAVLQRLFLYFILPICVLLGAYGAYYFTDLQTVFTQQGFSLAQRQDLSQMIFNEIGVVTLVALLGLLAILKQIWQKKADITNFFKLDGSDDWHRGRNFTIWLCLAILLFLLWLAAPLYHWLASNGRSLWKNNIYPLIFLIPLASFGIMMAIDFARNYSQLVKVGGLVIAFALLIGFMDKGLDDNWLFQLSWPDESNVINYLRESGLNESSHALVESMDIYEYYFDFGTQDRSVWHNVWYMEYGDFYGREAMHAAVRDHYFDFVVIENYYAPDIRELLDPTLVEAGYEVSFQEAQELRAGHTILLQVYTVPK